MISVYEFSDYREFLKAWFASHQGGGRGLKTELAQAMGVSSSLMSQILSGDKELNLDQASEAAERFGFTDNETDFWFLLVEKSRVAGHKLKARFERKIKTARDQAKSLSKRSLKDTELSEEVKGTYYSTWLYSGIRNLSAVPEFADAATLAKRLNLPVPLVANIVQFLVEKNLCRLENGQLTYGPAHTFLEKESPHAVKHHRNWRVKGFEAMDLRREEDMFFTSPMSLSKEAVEEIRRMLPDVIQRVYKIVGPSDSETVACLNIDWFQY